MIKIFHIFLSGLIASGLLVGCGSDGDGDTTTLTKTEFIRSADVVCKKAIGMQARAEIEYAQQHEKALVALPLATAQAQVRAAVGLPLILKEAEEIDALGAPEGDEEQVEEIVTGLEEGVEATEENPKSSEEGESPFVEVSRLATEYGFKVCAHVG
jgi:hypothetical protein